MNPRNEPMPLEDLPEYIKSVRENGQTDAPVVEMGRIVSRPAWGRPFAYAVAACIFIALGGVGVAFTATSEITIRSGAGPRAVAEMVSEEGGRVFSVTREENGAYKVRVLTFKKIGPLLERLKKNKDVEDAELD